MALLTDARQPNYTQLSYLANLVCNVKTLCKARSPS